MNTGATKEGRNQVPRRWLPLLAAAVLLAAAFLAAVFAEPQLDIAPPPDPDAARTEPGASASAELVETPTPSTRRRRALFEVPAWVDSLLTAGCLVCLAVVGVLLVWVVVRNTAQARGRPIGIDDGATAAATRAEDVAAAVDAGLAELSEADSDPRRAVIACWLRLEAAATAAGTPKRASDSPADYVLRLLAGHRVSRPVLDRFANVYRQARYGNGPVDDGMRATARSALSQLRAELAVEAHQ